MYLVFVITSYFLLLPREQMNYSLCADEEYLVGTGGSLYDGRQQVLYWADVLSELAFVVPSPETFRLRTMSSSTLESGE